MLTQGTPSVTIAVPSELPAWQNYVDGHSDAGPLHHAGWYHVLTESSSVTPYFFMAKDSAGKTVGVLPAYHSRSRLTGSHITSLEGGILSDTRAGAQALLDAALALRDNVHATYLQLRGGSAEYSAIPVPTVHTLIDTSRSSDQLWAAIKRKTRWGIKQAQKVDLVIESDPELNNLRNFYNVYAAHMRDLGTPVFGFSMFRAMREHLGVERLKLYLARYRGRLIGGMLCIVNAQRWTDWYAIMRGADEVEFANYLMYWQVIKNASDIGVRVIDLGRSSPGSNVHLFKRKWGGTDVDVPYYFYPRIGVRKTNMGLLDQKHSKGIMQYIWSRLPLPICNAIGPLVRRELPFI